MRIALIIVLTAALSACGFQLRGSRVATADLKSIYIEASDTLAEEVRVYLDGSGTRVLQRRQDADVILSLSGNRYDRRVLSVDPATGKEREYELSYTLDYHARQADGKTLLNSNRLTIRRDYVFDRTAVIGKSREAGVLRTEMRRDAIQQVLFRLQSALSG